MTTCKRSMQSRGTLAIYDARMHVENRMYACTINFVGQLFKVELILRFLPELSAMHSSWFIIGLGVQRRSVTLASKVDGNIATPCMMQPGSCRTHETDRSNKKTRSVLQLHACTTTYT